MATGPTSPIAPGERIEILDVLRGVAILGILLVNSAMFFQPIYLPVSGIRWWHGPIESAVEALVVFVAQAKFYALFSFLFGYGFALQSARGAARGEGVARFFSRRFGWLLAIGLAHALLIWFGDILCLYALLGLLLVPFRRRATRTLVVWAAVLILLPVVLQAVRLAVYERGVASDPAGVEQALVEQRETMAETVGATREAYAEGSLRDIFTTRAGEWSIVVSYGFLSAGPQILGLFIVGLALGRARLFENLRDRVPGMRRALPVLFACGAAGGVLQVAGSRLDDPLAPSIVGLLASAAQSILAPAMTAAYVCAIALAWQHDRWRRRLGVLAPVGRMALTSYLTHSVVLTTVAYSYGLGLYGRVPPSRALVMALALYAIQVPVSRAWLARFRFGPVEWLWRRLTYWAYWGQVSGSGLTTRPDSET